MNFFAEYYSLIISDMFLRNLFASALVLFIGGLIQGYTGFGGGTISVPVLVILFGPVVAIGIITPVYILGAATILPSAIKNVDWTEVLPVSIAGSIAVFVGLSFLITADPTIVKKIMVFFILFTTGVMILGKKYTG
ncbi:MAG: sulfite exporter TauE/SafE family protein, partial [Rhodospirillales bacterium]|nr:sulfite exporter TauE/SafE family protein [Rhodospirillales bacterium]